ncbi:IS3 family transposase [Avibacterium sp. 20-126]|uniref:IS3 family transposase n=1 Tax=Avibacterium sp. 20-126 TaxID=2911524 RepID=UPI002185F5B1|nr:IS3 family transposase [Avibacterium sp. 20-126]
MARSTFYYQEVKRDYTAEKVAIFSLCQASKQRDGYSPLTFKLRQIGVTLNHKTVLKLMRALQIQSIVRQRRHGKRDETALIAPNMLNRDFTATKLN